MDNREKILACALKLFASRGYDAVGVQEIVEAAGITKPTLYHYFGNKRGLLDALLKEQFERLNQVVKQAADYHGDLPLTLEQIMTAYFRFAHENRTFYRMQLAMTYAPPESEATQAVVDLRREQYRLLENMFVQAVRENGNMRGRQQVYAATLLGMINTYIGIWLNGFSELDEQQVYQAVHQFMHGILS